MLAFSRGRSSPLHAESGQRATRFHTGGLRSVFFRCTCPRKKRIAIYFPADRRKNSAEGFFVIVGKNILLAEAQNRRGAGPRRLCVLFEREKREREDVLMKAGSLLPDTYIIADPHGGVMDKIRIFYEGTVNVHVREASAPFRTKESPLRLGDRRGFA